MNRQSVLFIYDMAGTVQGPLAVAWAHAKKEQPDLTLAQFKAQQKGKYALFPGMADLIRYTWTKGVNILFSEGNPENEGCPELKGLFGYFQRWQYAGKEVPLGKIPDNLAKVDPAVATIVRETFSPQLVVVIGDSVGDYIFAYHLAHPKPNLTHGTQTPQVLPKVIFIQMGRQWGEENVRDSNPPVFFAESGQQMKHVIQEFLDQNCPQNLDNFKPLNKVRTFE